MIKINKLTDLNKINLTHNQIYKPFEKKIIDFLQQLSNCLMKDKSNIEYPEIISFAYWIRKSNIIKLTKLNKMI